MLWEVLIHQSVKVPLIFNSFAAWLLRKPRAALDLQIEPSCETSAKLATDDLPSPICCPTHQDMEMRRFRRDAVPSEGLVLKGFKSGPNEHSLHLGIEVYNLVLKIPTITNGHVCIRRKHAFLAPYVTALVIGEPGAVAVVGEKVAWHGDTGNLSDRG